MNIVPGLVLVYNPAYCEVKNGVAGCHIMTDFMD